MRQINDLRKLRHVVGVAKAGSFTSASRVLALTQSALTKSVAEVERQLGVKLFERNARGVRLTLAGESFVARAERLIDDADDLVLELRDVQMLAAGRLAIGVAPAGFVSFLETTLGAYAHVYPALSVAVEEGSEDRVVQLLLSGALDLVVGNSAQLEVWRELSIQPLAPLNLFFITRQDHPLAAMRKVTAASLLSYPVVMPATGLSVDQALRDAYRQAGLSPVPPRYRCNDFGLVTSLVAQTDAISPVLSLASPERLFRNRFRTFADVVRLPPQEICIATVKTREMSTAAEAFVDLFQGFMTDSNRA